MPLASVVGPRRRPPKKAVDASLSQGRGRPPSSSLESSFPGRQEHRPEAQSEGEKALLKNWFHGMSPSGYRTFNR